jgi:hypothetical protein
MLATLASLSIDLLLLLLRHNNRTAERRSME